LPPLLNVVFGAHELVRLKARLVPFGRIVLRPSRTDAGPAPAPRVPGAIAFEAVTFGYREGEAVLDRRSFTWPEGILLLQGANGSGKTTLFRLLLGLREPQGGRILLAGEPLSGRGLRARAGYLTQRPFLGEPHTTVEEAIRWIAPDASRAQMESALAMTGLLALLEKREGDVLRRPIGELSGGQRQRLALARILCREAAVVVLDEPDANLDQEGLRALVGVIERLRAEGRMVAVAAHGPLGRTLEGLAWDLDERAS